MKSVCRAFACLLASLPLSLLAQPIAKSSIGDAPAEFTPAQVGLIDLAYVFKNSHEFLSQMEMLQEEIEQADQEAKGLVDQIRSLQKQLASEDFASGSPEAAELEEKITRQRLELESFKRLAQQKFLRKEAEIYKSFYVKVEDLVARYANHYKYTLVLRFDRKDLATTENPQELMNSLNRDVVSYEKRDDITEPILNYLNREWEKGGGRIPQGVTRQNRAETSDQIIKANNVR